MISWQSPHNTSATWVHNPRWRYSISWKVEHVQSFGTFIQDLFHFPADAIWLTLKSIKASRNRNCIVFNDSKSCLQALAHLGMDHALMGNIFFTFIFSQKVPLWHPLLLNFKSGGNPGTKKADHAGRRKGTKTPCCAYFRLRPRIVKQMNERWQNAWYQHPGNKFYTVAPSGIFTSSIVL